jgi:hypothetical protein
MAEREESPQNRLIAGVGVPLPPGHDCDLIKSKIAELGENILTRRFTRYLS